MMYNSTKFTTQMVRSGTTMIQTNACMRKIQVKKTAKHVGALSSLLFICQL